MKNNTTLFNRLLLPLLSILCAQPVWAAPDVHLYTSRKADLIEPIIKKYQAKHQVNVKVTYGNIDELKSLLSDKRTSSTPDIFLSKSTQELNELDQHSLLYSIDSETLDKNIPLHLRSKTNSWFGISVRGRALIYNPAKVSSAILSNYAALAAPRWRNKLCMRTGNSIYNTALIASLIHHHGIQKAKKIVSMWKQNLSQPLTESDRQAIQSVGQGKCYATIANHYYFISIKENNPDYNLALFWPNQKNYGTHVGLSGVAVLKKGTNKHQALSFIEWLTMAEAQILITNQTNEFPVNPTIQPSKPVLQLGSFRQDSTPIESLSKLHQQALQLIQETSFHN